MRCSKALSGRFYCVPVLCALVMILALSTTTFASTAQQTVASAACPELKSGSTDASGQGKVTVLQKKLKDAGENLGTFGTKHDGIDGKFGSVTLAAVKSYQGKNKDAQGQPLKVDGIVGTKTWAALGGCAAASTPAPPATSGVACTASMSPLVRLYKEADKSSLCYNAAVKPTETISGVTMMCVNGGVTITYEAPASASQEAIDGGGYYVDKTFNAATTIHIVQITDTTPGKHINYCHID